MTEPSLDVLAARWFEYRRLSTASRAERKALDSGEPATVVAADEWVSERINRGGVVAVQVLVALAGAAPGGDDGATVGIGPVEDLLHAHGDEVVDSLVEHARRSPALSRALSHVELADGTLSDASLVRLRPYRGRA